MQSMKEQGQQGSPRGNIEKETGYIVILMAVYITWEMLLADNNTRVRHHIGIYCIMWYMMVFLAKWSLAVVPFP